MDKNHLRPWARRLPDWMLPIASRVAITCFLPVYLSWGIYEGLIYWLEELKDPY